MGPRTITAPKDTSSNDVLQFLKKPHRRKPLLHHFSKGFWAPLIAPGVEPYPQYRARMLAEEKKPKARCTYHQDATKAAWKAAPLGVKACVHVLKNLAEMSYTHLDSMTRDARTAYENSMSNQIARVVLKALLRAQAHATATAAAVNTFNSAITNNGSGGGGSGSSSSRLGL